MYSQGAIVYILLFAVSEKLKVTTTSAMPEAVFLTNNVASARKELLLSC